MILWAFFEGGRCMFHEEKPLATEVIARDQNHLKITF